MSNHNFTGSEKATANLVIRITPKLKEALKILSHLDGGGMYTTTARECIMEVVRDRLPTETLERLELI